MLKKTLISSNRKCLSVIFLLSVVVSLNAAWTSEPVNGWYFEYNAANGFRPDEISAAKHRIQLFGYQVTDCDAPAYSGIKTDENGKPVLIMVNNGASKKISDPVNTFSHYRYFVPSDLTQTKRITVELKYRLTDLDANKRQLAFSMIWPYQDNKSLGFSYSFSLKDISCQNENILSVIPCDLSRKLHKLRIHFDLELNKYSLYLDDGEIPLCKGSGKIGGTSPAYLQFGDGSSLVEGIAELEYFKWTKDEAVPIISSVRK